MELEQPLKYLILCIQETSNSTICVLTIFLNHLITKQTYYNRQRYSFFVYTALLSGVSVLTLALLIVTISLLWFVWQNETNYGTLLITLIQIWECSFRSLRFICTSDFALSRCICSRIVSSSLLNALA
jgi:hypothetical protein